MKRPRSAFASVAVLLALAACGNDGSSSQESAHTNASSPATTSRREPADTPTSRSHEPAGADTAPSSAATRTVQHAMGTTDVPAEPQRVVVLDSSFLDAAVALGVTPIGATEASEGSGIPDYLADEVPQIEMVGLTNEPNLEAIAALNPDLVLGAKVRHKAHYTTLSGIAPTVFTESSGTNWKDGLEVTAEALGKAGAAESLLAEYEARADAIGEEVGAQTMQVSVVRFLLPDEIRIYGPETFSGTVLTDVGFDLGDHQWDEYSMAYISPEQLGLADADVIFSTSYGGSDTPERDASFKPVRSLWESVPAVARGRQHWMDDDVWMLGIGPVGAQLILDDIERALASSG